MNRAASPTSDISPKTQAPLSISGAGAKFADPPRPGSAEETLKTPVAEGNGKQPAAGYFPAVEPGRAANGGTTSSTDKAKSPASPSDDDIDPLDTSRIKTDAAPSTAPQRPQVFVVNRTPDGQPSDVRRVQSAGDAEGKVAAGKDGLGGPVEPPASRRASVTSLSFRLPSAPGLPQGHPRLSNAARIRSSSPPPEA